ncbi:MAG: single-stranded DNA-binding protein [Candidatus Staskawiczbacteria bacterium]|nr:single-stranded DNA-binding protein [Candidatus Staskawiczbacteria bacterium]
MNLNKAFILGNVTRDPEVRALPSGQSVTNFGIATNRFYTDASGQKKQEAEFHNIVCFGKLADISSRYLNKGSLVLIEGRIKTRSWQNAQGLKQYRTEIIADGLQLAPKSMGGATGNYSGKNFGPESQESNNQPTGGDIPIIEENYTPPDDNSSKESQGNSADEIDVKDIPF